MYLFLEHFIVDTSQFHKASKKVTRSVRRSSPFHKQSTGFRTTRLHAKKWCAIENAKLSQSFCRGPESSRCTEVARVQACTFLINYSHCYKILGAATQEYLMWQ
ncbi:unnamed protein product [Rangifer tarandus platyrhynchus]|uniref:Uncharacterized protein n=2 Tax=Rangifer tarandus platyrhynchus TaxID=3082113 RepID=A0AC60A721_RANTA|nr:unnamed protein product [Rangifer tarandus platyrhynchus]